MKKPNIVMLVTDHQVYAHHAPLMPNFSKLQSDGFSFDKATCVTPLCGPARRSLLTGLYPHNHHNLYNFAPAPFVEDTYLDILAAAGYRNFEYGKWHAGPGTAYDHHTEGFSVPEYGNPYVTDEYRDYIERKGLPVAEHEIYRVFPNNNTSETFPHLKDGECHYSCDAYWCGEQAVGRTVTPKETHESFFLADMAIEKLRELASAPYRSPFHLRVDFWGPHHPYFPTDEYIRMYDGVDIPKLPNFRDDLSMKPKTYRHMNRPIADEHGELIVPSIYSWNEWSDMLKIVYAQSTMIDAAAGMIINAIDELGFGDDTVIIWTSDHGDAFASHGGMFDKGSFMTEEIIRIPLVIRMPGVKGASDALVNTIDIAPTILDIAGTAFTGEVDGTSILPVLKGRQESVRDSLMLESFGQGYRDMTKVRCLLEGDFKYCITENDIDEMYDLASDPYEMRNLSYDPAYGQKAAELRKKLVSAAASSGDDISWMERQDDRGINHQAGQ